MIANPYSREKPTMADQRLGRLAMLSQVGDQNDLADARDQAGDMEALKSLYGIASESATQPYKIGQIQSETQKNIAGAGAEDARTGYENAAAAAQPTRAEAMAERNTLGIARAAQTAFPGGIPTYLIPHIFPQATGIPEAIQQHDTEEKARQDSLMLDDATKTGDYTHARASGHFTPEQQATWPAAPTPPDSSPYAVGKRVHDIPELAARGVVGMANKGRQFMEGLTGGTGEGSLGPLGQLLPNAAPWNPTIVAKNTKPKYNPNFNPD